MQSNIPSAEKPVQLYLAKRVVNEVHATLHFPSGTGAWNTMQCNFASMNNTFFICWGHILSQWNNDLMERFGTCWKAFINEILYQNINFFFKFLEAIFQVIFKLLILAILWKFCKSTIPCYFYLCETLSIRVTLNKPASEIPWFLRQK